MKPVILIGLTGGCAEVEVMPPNSPDVKTLYINWDDLRDDDDPPTPERIRDYIEQAKAMPGEGEYADAVRNNTVKDLQEILDKLER